MAKKKRKRRADAGLARKQRRITDPTQKPTPLPDSAITDLRSICDETGFLEAIKDAAWRYSVSNFSDIKRETPAKMASRYREIIKSVDSLQKLLKDFGGGAQARDVTMDLLAGDAVYPSLNSGEECHIGFAHALCELRKLRSRLNSALCLYGFGRPDGTSSKTRTNAKRFAERFIVALVEDCFSKFGLKFSSHVNGSAVRCLSIVTLERENEENLSAWIKTYRREKKKFTAQLEANRVLS